MQRQTGGPGSNISYYALDTALFDGYGAKLGDTDAFTGGAETIRDAQGFQGQFGAYTDTETGLVLMGHRYYDAGTGRFLTRDPIGYQGGINLYGFTGNNPVNESDPNGTQEDAADVKTEDLLPEDDTPANDPYWQDRFMPDTMSPEYQREKELDELAARIRNPRGITRGFSDRDYFIRQINQVLVLRLRQSAGFSPQGKPYLIDQNLTVGLSVSNAAKLMSDLRGAGYNARSVQEIFGKDPGDAVLRTFNAQIGAEPITRDRGRDIGGGFAGQANKNISIGLTKIPGNDRVRIFNFLTAHLKK